VARLLGLELLPDLVTELDGTTTSLGQFLGVLDLPEEAAFWINTVKRSE